MSVAYDFSVSGDFPTGRVRADLLQKQVNDDSAISVDCQHVTTNGDVCSVVFASALSGPQETALDAVVAAHNPGNGILAAKNYFIRTFHASTTLPGVDTWYTTMDAQTYAYSNPAEQTTYTYDAQDQLLQRVLKAYTTDGVVWTEVKYLYFTDPDTGDRVMHKEDVL
jgi:YD repeat-containing protein